jgi:hypothetical protein
MYTIFSYFAVAYAAGEVQWAKQNREFVYRLSGVSMVGAPLPDVRGQGVKVTQDVKIVRNSQNTYIVRVRKNTELGLCTEDSSTHLTLFNVL